MSASKPRYDILPAIGSPRAPCRKRCIFKDCPACTYWMPLRQKNCVYCHLILGDEACVIMIWPDLSVAHAFCFEQYYVRQKAYLRMQTVVEAAAEKAGMPPTNLLALPSYEIDRLCRPILDSLVPDWLVKIVASLQSDIQGSPCPPNSH